MQFNKETGNFCTFLERRNFSFQKITTVKVDMKQVPVLHYNNLQNDHVQHGRPQGGQNGHLSPPGNWN